MLLRTHFMIALLCGLLAMSYFNFSWLFLIVVLISTLISDLDSSRSRYGKKFWLLRPIQWLAGHRKIFHSFIFIFLIGVGIWFLSREISYAFVFGYGLHLLIDCLTLQGVMLFYPFSDFRIKGFIKTGGWIEWGIFLVSFLGVVLVLNGMFF